MKLQLLFVGIIGFLSLSAQAAEGPKVGALLQAWTINDTTDPTANFNFRLRRAEIKVTGSVADNTRYFVMIDPAKNLPDGSNTKILQDLGVAFNVTPEVELIAGQFKILTVAEGLDSSSELLLPERSMIGRVYGDRREPGLLVAYKHEIIKLSGMIFNGQGTNTNDKNNPKDIALRAEVTPIDMLHLGAFTQAGDFKYSDKGRWGTNASLSYESLILRAEYVHATDLGISTDGWYADAGYLIGENFEPLLRWDSLSLMDTTAHAPSVGLNYFIKKHNSKIQASLTSLNNTAGSNGSYKYSPSNKGTLFLLNFQTAL